MVTNESMNRIWSQLNETYSENSSSTINILDQITEKYVVHLPLLLIILDVIRFLGNSFTYLQPNF
jgi:hypothetical protein